jgi:hypothetical protein
MLKNRIERILQDKNVAEIEFCGLPKAGKTYQIDKASKFLRKIKATESMFKTVPESMNKPFIKNVSLRKELESLKKITKPKKIVKRKTMPNMDKKRELEIFPPTVTEIAKLYPSTNNTELLTEICEFGCLSNVFSKPSRTEKRKFAKNYVEKEVLDRIFQNEEIKNQESFLKLVRILANNIGNETRLRDLSRQTEINLGTVKRYISLLEKYCIIFPIFGFRDQLANEVYMFPKFYFLDNIIAMHLIQTPGQGLSAENMNKLWENLCISEYYKTLNISGLENNVLLYYWQTYDGQKIDLVVWNMKSRKIKAFNCRANLKGVRTPPKLWVKHYKNSSFDFLGIENLLKRITEIEELR